MINIIKLFIKQYFCKNKYSLIIFAFIACFSLFFFNEVKEEESNNIKIGFYIEDEKDYSIGEKLLIYDGIFKFYHCDEEELRQNVLSGELDCGYIFKSGFLQNILNGNIENQVVILKSAGTYSYKMSYEVVFAQMLEVMVDDFLLKYIENNDFFYTYNKEELHDRLKSYFEKHLDSSTFKFEYETLGKENFEINTTISPIREFIAFYIFILALFGLSNINENKNILKNAKFKERFIVSQISIFLNVIIASILGFILIYTFKINENIFKEIISMTVYFVLLLVFVEILYFVLNNKYIIFCTIPTIIIMALIICPIFMDLGNYIKPVKYLQKVFPLYYYLEMVDK